MRNSYFSDERFKVYDEVEIFHKIDYNKPLTWKHIKHLDLQDDDVIHAGHDEGFYEENNAMDPHYFIDVTRKVIETDEQFKERVERLDKQEVERQERRYQSYLKLKAEFEPEAKP